MSSILRTLMAASLLCAFVATATAQQVLDGSDSSYGENIAEDIATSLVDSVADPYSVQIIKLAPSTGNSDIVCGYLNIKNQTGGYTGFQPFYFNVKSKTISLRQSSGCTK